MVVQVCFNTTNNQPRVIIPQKGMSRKAMRMYEFATRLQQLREQRGISRRALSELCGLSSNMVARYERAAQMPSLNHAAALADFFNVSIDYLAGRQ